MRKIITKKSKSYRKVAKTKELVKEAEKQVKEDGMVKYGVDRKELEESEHR